jgi:queuosine precursor transporter
MFKIEKLDLLVSLYIFCIAASELMGSKTFPITQFGDFKLNASVAIFTVPIIFSINDVIAEVFGKERARSVVRSGILVVAMIFLFALLVTSLPPSVRSLPNESAYDKIFQASARFALASLTAFALSDLLDVYLFSKIRELFGKSKLWLRVNLSNLISQFIDTTVFITLAFYALDRGFSDNFAFLAGIIIPYWLLKSLMSVVETPFVYLGVRWLKGSKK